MQIVAELGINHNGDLKLARKLIDAAAWAGADVVKFQKRCVESCWPAEYLDQPRKSPWGSTVRDQKYGLEFSLDEYRVIDQYCSAEGIPWTVSCWDRQSLGLFAEQFDLPYLKIASPCLTDFSLLKMHAQLQRPLIMSTGMSSLRQIDHAVGLLEDTDLTLLHCTSTYPCPVAELNLAAIGRLRDRYQIPIGYSSHFVGLCDAVAAVALGACMIEKHLTLDRSMYGSDQAASVEPHGFRKMVQDCWAVRNAMGDGIKTVYDSELAAMEKLRVRS